MSDATRKDLHDKVGDHITPDHSKSTTDKVKDTVTGTTDKIERDVLPDSQKSTTQATTDKLSREKDAHTSSTTGTTTGATDESLLDKAKHAVGLDNKK